MTLTGSVGNTKRAALRGRNNPRRSTPREVKNAPTAGALAGQSAKGIPQPGDISGDLLAWYDRHRRSLPWRVAPGEKADPYRVWLSEIMLQQTTVTAVIPYFARFVARFPTVTALAVADTEEVLGLWAGLGYYARARNLHACARVVAARGGAFPEREEDLLALPGIGIYTAAAIAAIAFDRRAAAVDGNGERVLARLFAVEAPLPGAKPMLRALAADLVPERRAGDFAQALMDLGRTICTPKAPACALCPIMAGCGAHARGEPGLFPRKAEKRRGGLRRGAAYVAVRADGHVLVRRRVAKGLLGGMTEVPTSEWRTDFDFARASEHAPEIATDATLRWHRVAGVVTHMFTHFPLELVVFKARLPAATPAPAGMRWLAADEIGAAALPSLMRKVLAHAGVA